MRPSVVLLEKASHAFHYNLASTKGSVPLVPHLQRSLACTKYVTAHVQHLPCNNLCLDMLEYTRMLHHSCYCKVVPFANHQAAMMLPQGAVTPHFLLFALVFTICRQVTPFDTLHQSTA